MCNGNPGPSPSCNSDLLSAGRSPARTRRNWRCLPRGTAHRGLMLIDQRHHSCKDWCRRRRTANADKRGEGRRICEAARHIAGVQISLAHNIEASADQTVGGEKRDVWQIPEYIRDTHAWNVGTALPRWFRVGSEASPATNLRYCATAWPPPPPTTSRLSRVGESQPFKDPAKLCAQESFQVVSGIYDFAEASLPRRVRVVPISR